MIRAAGIMFACGSQVLLLKRRDDARDHPGEWCFPGGHAEPGEDAEETARREAAEECGAEEVPPGQLIEWTRSISQSQSIPQEKVDFTTFVQKCRQPFTPELNEEHTAFAWARYDAPPEPLHPGCRAALAKLDANELDVARMMAAGELISPQKYENLWLFCMRVTGTDTAYRRARDEYVYRPPENYMTEDFLARCNGLPVIVEHPEQMMLDGDEFKDRVVGTVFVPYLRPEDAEVWAVVKVWDEAAAELLRTRQLSTSPAVVFRDMSVCQAVDLEDGSSLLIEGKPSLLDHLAICTAGVWDKGGPPTGVEVTAIGDSAMPLKEEEKKVEKKDEKTEARADAQVNADISQKLDAVLGVLGALSSRMDSIEETEKQRAEAEKKARAARKDSDEDDEKDRKDEDKDKEDEAKKDSDEDDEKAKKDAEEKKDSGDGDREEKVLERRAEKDRKDRKDEDEKGGEKIAAEIARKDAEHKAEVKSLKEEMARLAARIPKPLSDADYHKMADAQAEADRVFLSLGDHQGAPRPLDGETLNSYRRRLASKLKTYSTRWKETDLGAIADDNAFDVIVRDIYADAMSYAMHPTDLEVSQLRPITKTDETGRRITTFAGQPMAWMQQFAAPRQHVTEISNGTRTI